MFQHVRLLLILCVLEIYIQEMKNVPVTVDRTSQQIIQEKQTSTAQVRLVRYCSNYYLILFMVISPLTCRLISATAHWLSLASEFLILY
jgi:hypothetical protein